MLKWFVFGIGLVSGEGYALYVVVRICVFWGMNGRLGVGSSLELSEGL